jgi:hypothetical protein
MAGVPDGMHGVGAPLIPVPPLYMEPSIDTATAGVLGIEPPEPMQGALGAPVPGTELAASHRCASDGAAGAAQLAHNDSALCGGLGNSGADSAMVGRAIASKELPLPLPLDVGNSRDFERT